MTEERQRISGKTRQKIGRVGETLATSALEKRGYCILERNFRCRAGEIDLIAQAGEDLVFIEVKTRRGTACGLPEEAITRRKARTLQQVAWFYLDAHNLADCSWRIDVVAVQFNQAGQLEEVRVYPHAVSASPDQ